MPFPFSRGAVALAGATAMLAGPLVLPASAAPVTVQVVGISDFHGRLEPIGETEDDAALPIGGAVQLAGVLDGLVDANPNTLFAAAGDNIGASTFTSNVQQDTPTIEALDAMGLDVSAVGNHEFDRGFVDIAKGARVDGLADFPYLGANVYATGSDDPVLDPSFVADTPAGVRVGFVGVVTQETASLVNPAGVAGLEFGDEVAAANREAALLQDGDESNGEADVVVLLLHDGSDGGDCAGDSTLQALTADVDAVIAGHTHESYECDPFAGTAGFTGPVVQAGEYGEAVDLLTFTVDGEDVTASAQILPVVGVATTGTRATAVSAIVDAAVAVAQQEGAAPLGEITADITRAFAADGSEDRGAESVLGNFVADVQLERTATAGAQIAFMNPGGLRDDFLVASQFGSEAPGVVTLGEANAVQPFANGVVTLTLTGAQVEQVLEEQWQPTDASRPFLALGVSAGFSFTYDPGRAQGERITSVTLDGAALDPAAAYRVTVNSFLAAGGDNFLTLAEGTDRQELGVTDLEALVGYLDANSPVTADTASRRAVSQGPPRPSPQPSPEDEGDGEDVGERAGEDDVNPGLFVDTGAEQPEPAAGALALAGAVLLAAAGGVAVRRRRGGAQR